MDDQHLFDTSLLLDEKVKRLRFTNGRSTYTAEKPLTVQCLPDDMLRIITIDGVSHTQRRWYSAIIIDYADGSSHEYDTGEVALTASVDGVWLVPSGVTRIICGFSGVCEFSGPVYFHYGGIIGVSAHEDIGMAMSDYDTFTHFDSQDLVKWWRDE